ncbi:MAG: PAS domain S-box protein [Syntrophales bacterium]
MNGAPFIGLVQNVALLLAAAFLFDVAASRWRTGLSVIWQVPVGLAIGAIAVTVMLTPWTFQQGIVFDTRSVLLGISGLFFGPVPTAIAMAMTALFRFYQGGTGAWTGIAVILASGVIGIAWRYFRRCPLTDISWGELYLFGIAVHCAMLLLMLTLPRAAALPVLSHIALPVIVIYPLGTALLGTLIARRLRSEQAEDTLRESEDRYRSLFDNSTDAVLLTAPDGTILAANPEACRIFGHTEEEICRIGRPGLTDPTDPRLPAALAERARTGQFRGELTFVRKDGTSFPGEISSVIFRDRNANPKTSMIIRDITAAKNAERILREKSRLNQTLLDAFPCVALLLRPHTREIIASNAAAVNVGALPGTHCFSEWGQRQDPCPWCLAPVLWATGEAQYLEVEALGICWEAHWIPVEKDLYMHYAIDITERKRAEHEKRRNQETVERLAAEMAMLAEIGRAVGSTLDINQVFERADTEIRKVIPCDRLLVNLKKGDDFEEFVVVYASGVDNPGRRLADSYPSKGTSTRFVMTTRTGILIQPDDPEEIKDLYPNLYATIVNFGLHSAMSVPLISMDEVIGCLTFRSKKPKAYTEQDLHLAEKIGMQIAGAIANAQLYKDLSKTERSLRESEETYRELVEFLPFTVFEADSNLRIISFNHTALETFRYTATDPIRDMDGHQFFMPTDWERLDKDVREVMVGASKSSLEYRFVRKDGSTFIGLAYVSPIIRQGVVIGVRGAVIDITDRIKAMEELQRAKDYLLQSEKLAAIGRLAAGVTHEILNPVTIISLELQMLMRERDLSAKTRQRLTVCMEQINRIVNIAEGLKGFSRVKENRLAMGDIAAIVDYILTLYQPQLKMKEIQTDVQCAANLPMTLMDRERVEQVILNLIENAVSSMEETREKTLRIAIDRRSAAGKKDVLRVTIADTGTGIRKQDMTKLFEPFFTTKPPGKGTGLGLSISFGIIEDHGGRIWAENNEWGGASFFFEIPIIADESGTITKAKETTHGEDSGGR